MLGGGLWLLELQQIMWEVKQQFQPLIGSIVSRESFEYMGKVVHIDSSIILIDEIN